MGFSRKSKQAPPEYGHVDSDDDSVPPAPPPPPMMGMGGEDSQSEDHFQDHLDPAGTGVHDIAHGHGHGNNDADEEDKAPVKKWRLLKREAEHVLIPQDEPNNNNNNHMDGNGNGMDMENALDGGSQHLANNPNGNVPMQGHFRGIQSAQDFDEEEAGMDEIEVPSSSVVARMNHKERKHMGQFRNSKYFKLAMLLVLGVVVIVAVTLGSVLGTRGDGEEEIASAERGGVGGDNGNGNGNNADATNANLNTPAGRYIQSNDNNNFSQSTVDALSVPGSPAAEALAWINDNDANANNGFGEADDMDEETMMNFEQRFAAAAFRNSLGGADWVGAGDDGDDDAWMSEKDVCEWKGITCGNLVRKLQGQGNERKLVSASSVTKIDLTNTNIRGPLPAEIGLFTDLEELILISNWVSGTLPEELFDLTNLIAIDLYDNVITGSISPNFANLDQLAGLYLGMNQLTGKIPVEVFQNMESLQSIWFNDNFLTGNLPDVVISNEINDEASSLRDIDVKGNTITGVIPESYANLPNLMRLNLDSNDLTGGIPDAFAMSNLTEFYLGGNMNLFGYMPDEEDAFPLVVFDMVNLEALTLNNCGIIGALPGVDYETQFLNLLEWDIGDNQFTGTVPLNYGGVQSLTKLRMANSNFEGELPWSFRDLVNLVELDMSLNRFTDVIPDQGEWAWSMGLNSLEVINLGGNWISGPIPDTWAKWTSMRKLILDNNMLTGEIPAWLPTLGNLEEIRLEWNRYEDAIGFSGPIPDQLINLQSLQVIHLQGNSLTGEIPNLPLSLIDIKLNDNALEGDMPDSFAQMGALVALTFQDNFIQYVPEDICQLNLGVLTGGCEVTCACCTDQCEVGVRE
uniref:Leucine-rich repeat-containing N-terminal plant-type domain-containing protein n=2 Tax=Chaetoceros debilis TaxID=122233 RepID=A0A7S3QF39_9STRA|mmetsp:Transcript_28308/g.43373  ORF Transcript_28308/g.43373 Transcript_28308/m.43373 type:complete len:856 (+) Transcript_28308:392-2959(+)